MTRPDQALVELAAGRGLPVRLVSGELVASAMEHRMDGLLHSEIRSGRARSSPAVAAELAASDLVRRRRVESMWASFQHVHAVTRDLGGEVAMLKGPSAEWRWYDRAGERPCGDLDVWLSPGSRPIVRELADRLDPTGGSARLDFDRWVPQSLLQSLQFTVCGVAVDLHLDALKLGVPTRLDDELWDRTVLIEHPVGGPARVLDPVGALLHMLLHLNKDRFRFLLGAADIVRILDRDAPDLSELRTLAERGGLVVPVLESLRSVLRDLDRLDISSPAHDHRLRSVAWNALWPEHRRLLGGEGVIAMRHRQELIPALMTGPGRARHAAQRWARILFPPRELFDRYHSDGQGGYVRRLLTARMRRQRTRRDRLPRS